MQDGNGKKARIAAVEDILRGRDPAAAPFCEPLLGGVAASDLEAYAPADLAECVRAAVDHLEAKGGKGPDIRLIDLRADVGGRRREMTMLQIVNDDMPFLVDSTLAALGERGHAASLVLHPMLDTVRDAAGRILSVKTAQGPRAPDGRRESLIQIHLERIDAATDREALVADLAAVHRDVGLAVKDWGAMRARLAAAVAFYRTSPPPLPAEEIEEAVVLLEWLEKGNFTLLGTREYRLPDGEAAADPIAGTGLGILSDPEVKVLKRGGEMVTITPEIRAFLGEPVPLIVTKASARARVHRRAYLDYVGVKLFEGGRLTGELVIVGLLTSTAYTESVGAVPFVRRKARRVIELAGYDPATHSGRALLNVLENYPRDELFQIDEATLLRFSLEILAVHDRPRVKALARADRYGRFVSVIVFVPKERYDTETRIRIGDVLAELFGGRASAAYPAYPEGPLARTHFIIGRDGGEIPAIDPATLDEAVARVVRTWADELRETLDARTGGTRGRALAARYARAFTGAYQEAFAPERAVPHIAILERSSAERPRAVRFDGRDGEAGRAGLEIFARGGPLALSLRVPLIESMGLRVLDERTYRIAPGGAEADAHVWLHDMLVERAAGGSIDVGEAGGRLETMLMALLGGHAAADGYNALGLEAGLGWRDVNLLRALSRHLIQIKAPFSHDYMAAAMTRHPALAAKILALFYARFDPRAAASRERACAAIRAEIEAGLDAVESLDDDRILRRFVNLVEAAERTNFFRIGPDGLPAETIGIKFASRSIEGMPLPAPLHEIFVYGRKVEGVHLRFGPVARGGLRWSDRKEDYRTEVLGLVKAQQVKNAVIVPAGAKGGFYPKELPSPADRQAYLAEGVAAYRVFIGTLLDVTDDLRGGELVPPPDVVRQDGDDPYLVVAADKGTATFSDIANGIAEERGFWLGDAFASGGSNGYDHKGMGITARGAWEAVKRHFRERDMDVQTTPFTVAGVGDMSGDVFGNGMLLSKKIRLVAAFDHRHLFLDPDPDPEVSWAERERLFGLPRSSWADYDAKLISKGGGIFPRSLKAVPLSPEVRALLDLDKDEATPQEIMSAVLKARVDLLWFGGIGTYVRASTETDAEVGDRANDAIRVTGSDIRATVVGEGANLGVTQRGRIEAAFAGVRLNTDAIDNSAGVNTSDVEVNIKIALKTAEADGRLDGEARKTLLASMTGDVADLVLANNRAQTLALSLAERRGMEAWPDLVRSIRLLEASGRLDRSVEFLPDDARLADREQRRRPFSRPELAVLLAYEKMALKEALLASAVPDDPALAHELEAYFPKALTERFPDAVDGHRLRRNIIATRLANLVVDRGGIGLVAATEGMTGADPATIAAAFHAGWTCFGMAARFEAAEAAADMSGVARLALFETLRRFAAGRCLWLARETMRSPAAVGDVVRRFAPVVAHLSAPGGGTSASATDGLARLADALDAALVAERCGGDIAAAATAYAAIGRETGLDRLFEDAGGIASGDRFERLAVDRALSRLADARRRLAAARIAGTENGLAARIGVLVEDVASGPLGQARLTVLADGVADMIA